MHSFILASTIKDPIPFSNFEYLKGYMDKKVPADMHFDFPNISIETVYLSLKNLDNSNSTGLDNIGPRLLRLAAQCIALIVSFIIVKILQLFRPFGKKPK